MRTMTAVLIGSAILGAVLISGATSSDQTQPFSGSGQDYGSPYIDGSQDGSFDISKLLGSMQPNIYNFYADSSDGSSDLTTKKSSNTSSADPISALGLTSSGTSNDIQLSPSLSRDISIRSGAPIYTKKSANITYYYANIDDVSKSNTYNPTTGTGTNSSGQGYSSAFDLTKKKTSSTSVFNKSYA